jgi:hypothetical protein
MHSDASSTHRGRDRAGRAVRQAHDTLSAIIREIADLTKRRADAERRATICAMS